MREPNAVNPAAEREAGVSVIGTRLFCRDFFFWCQTLQFWTPLVLPKEVVSTLAFVSDSVSKIGVKNVFLA